MTGRAAGLVLVALAMLVACGGRQDYLYAAQGQGATGRQGDIVVSNAVLAFSGPLGSPVAYRAGDSAPISASIVNSGSDADRLVSVQSPVAVGATIAGDTSLPGGHVVAVGPQPGAQALPDTTSARVTLTGLRQDLRHGLTYPVVFTFARAGAVRLQLPVAVPVGTGCHLSADHRTGVADHDAGPHDRGHSPDDDPATGALHRTRRHDVRAGDDHLDRDVLTFVRHGAS